MDNEQLLDRLKQGDEAVFQGIYDEYRDAFVKWASVNYHLDQDTLLDIFQEAIAELFLKVKANKYHSEKASVKTYLFSIAKNYICELNRNGWFNGSCSFSPEISSDKELNIPDQVLDDPQLEGTIDELLGKLGHKQRKVMELYYLEGYSMKQIAKKLGYNSSDAVKVIKYRAISYIKSNFDSKSC